ncbi:ABC-type transport system involved in multi-copper enzyme maturation permease subunit [Aequitasia blattaphilus]|uniref:ABC transporter permease n=1 Tax=Aequitasia blattaphilus TaxID=2949332 RepID=A0ABT1EBZ5_9FIRM|nr:ABC transporter permease [Aequitasia blattaphilus]MCP1103196.1 ABC transporter permease [Aequitasia blattaphilus]MCR8615836.1 ABC transporter permease [Aequitasia blattaphilus]
MYNLIKLELRKTRIRPYVWASAIIALCMLGMLYTFSAVSYMGSEADAAEFSSYYNIMVLTNALIMFAFSILAAVMFTAFVIKDYSGKNAIMLFSYPVKRKSTLFAKVILVTTFTTISLLATTFAICSVWGLTESIFPLVDDSISILLVANVIRDALCMAVISVGIGLVSVWIGFRKKSVQTTIIAAVIISIAPANFIVLGTSYPIASVGLAVISAVAGVLALFDLSNAVNKMEI